MAAECAALLVSAPQDPIQKTLCPQVQGHQARDNYETYIKANSAIIWPQIITNASLFPAMICNKALQQCSITRQLGQDNPVDVSMPCTGCGNKCNTPTHVAKHAKDPHETVIFVLCFV